jgi:hypothetical protein
MNELEEKEMYLYGEIVSEPKMYWKSFDSNKQQLLTGWRCKLQTNSITDINEHRIINVELVYDLIKWNQVMCGEMVKLSIKGKFISSTTDEEFIKCNVVIRK